MTDDDDTPGHDPDPDHDCPVCSAKRDIREMLRDEMTEILREIIVECQDDLAGGKQSEDENMDARITIMACTELLAEMGESVEQQKEGTVH